MRLLSLILAQLNMNFGISVLRYEHLKKRERLWEPILIALAILSLAISVGVLTHKLALAYYSQLEVIGQEGALLTMILMLTQLILLFFGFGMVISVFYFSNDLELLIPLPLTPKEVLTCKFAVILVNEYLVALPFFFPVFLLYATKTGAGLVYWLSAILVFLIMPVIPLAVAAIPAILLIRVTNLSRKKDFFLIVGGFLLMSLVIAGQMYLNTKLMGVDEELFLQELLSRADGLMRLIGAKFPPSIWGSLAMSQAGTTTGLLNLLAFAGVSFASMVVLLFVGDRVFYQGLISGFDVASHRKTSKSLPKGRFLQRSSTWSLALVEVKNFLRVPSFVLNGLAGFVILPVMFAFPAFSKDPQLEAVLSMVPEGFKPLLIAAQIITLVITCSIPTTAFSRDGRQRIWILRSFPIDGEDVLASKLLGAHMIIVPGSLIGSILLGYIFNLTSSSLLLGTILGVMASLIFGIWGILVDMARPMLDWTDERKAIKSNLNTMIGMLIGMAMAFGIGYLVVLAMKQGIYIKRILTGVTLLLGLGLILSWSIGRRLALRIWDNMEI